MPADTLCWLTGRGQPFLVLLTVEFTHAQVAPVIRESGGRSRRGLIVAAVVAAAVTVIGGAAAAAGTLTCSATAAAPTGNQTAARSGSRSVQPVQPVRPARAGSY